MLNSTQEQQVKSKITEAKKLLQEAMQIIKTDWDNTFETKDVTSPDGQAWIGIVGPASGTILELEKILDIDLQVAASFEGRMDNAKTETTDT
jgi:hypothetical protein